MFDFTNCQNIVGQISIGRMLFMQVSLGQKFFFDIFKGYLECSIKGLLMLNLISQNAHNSTNFTW
jgi:hypothetical protein